MNYIAILAGAISVMILGWIWFHPKVFGLPWMKGVGLTEEDTKSANPITMIVGFLMALGLSYSISRFAGHPEDELNEFMHGMYHGFLPAIHFVVPILISKAVFEKKKASWILISTVYWVLAMMLVGGVTYGVTALFPAPEPVGQIYTIKTLIIN